jgi:uncharacterized protein
MSATTESSSKLLLSAVKRGDRFAIRKAIQSGADLNCEDTQGWTPLFHAAGKGDIKTMTLILDAGADVNHGVEKGFTALFSAVMSGSLDAVRALLSAGARVVPVGGIELPLHVQNRTTAKGRKLIRMLQEAQNRQAVGR